MKHANTLIANFDMLFRVTGFICLFKEQIAAAIVA